MVKIGPLRSIRPLIVCYPLSSSLVPGTLPKPVEMYMSWFSFAPFLTDSVEGDSFEPVHSLHTKMGSFDQTGSGDLTLEVFCGFFVRYTQLY